MLPYILSVTKPRPERDEGGRLRTLGCPNVYVQQAAKPNAICDLDYDDCFSKIHLARHDRRALEPGLPGRGGHAHAVFGGDPVYLLAALARDLQRDRVGHAGRADAGADAVVPGDDRGDHALDAAS